jgi:hypothetical protein
MSAVELLYMAIFALLAVNGLVFILAISHALNKDEHE